jgi:hypothetical protein
MSPGLKSFLTGFAGFSVRRFIVFLFAYFAFLLFAYRMSPGPGSTLLWYAFTAVGIGWGASYVTRANPAVGFKSKSPRLSMNGLRFTFEYGIVLVLITVIYDRFLRFNYYAVMPRAAFEALFPFYFQTYLGIFYELLISFTIFSFCYLRHLKRTKES